MMLKICMMNLKILKIMKSNQRTKKMVIRNNIVHQTNVVIVLSKLLMVEHALDILLRNKENFLIEMSMILK